MGGEAETWGGNIETGGHKVIMAAKIEYCRLMDSSKWFGQMEQKYLTETFFPLKEVEMSPD